MGRGPRRDARRHGTEDVIVVDSSAWVEFLRRTGSPVNEALRTALATGTGLGVVDVVRLEILAGATTDAQVLSVSRLLARGTALPADSPGDHEHAAVLYRAARHSGQTVRSLIDCLVAAVALRVDAPVLARDRDYEVLAGVSRLRLV